VVSTSKERSGSQPRVGVYRAVGRALSRVAGVVGHPALRYVAARVVLFSGGSLAMFLVLVRVSSCPMLPALGTWLALQLIGAAAVGTSAPAIGPGSTSPGGGAAAPFTLVPPPLTPPVPPAESTPATELGGTGGPETADTAAAAAADDDEDTVSLALTGLLTGDLLAAVTGQARDHELSGGEDQ
jgi:hypothetical protein